MIQYCERYRVALADKQRALTNGRTSRTYCDSRELLARNSDYRLPTQAKNSALVRRIQTPARTVFVYAPRFPKPRKRKIMVIVKSLNITSRQRKKVKWRPKAIGAFVLEPKIAAWACSSADTYQRQCNRAHIAGDVTTGFGANSRRSRRDPLRDDAPRIIPRRERTKRGQCPSRAYPSARVLLRSGLKAR